MNTINSNELLPSDEPTNYHGIPPCQETEFGKLSGESRIGGRKENQDSFGYLETKHGLLVVVCDGMGGAKGGKTASQLAVDTIINKVESSNPGNNEELLVKAIEKANETVYNTSRKNPELTGMGTTVVALLVDKDKATAAHVGDSRIYQIREGRKVFRTFDHSMVFELVKRGTISEEQARLSAESNVILRALGTKPEISIEINGELPYLKGDRFLLCSDGICGAVPENELIKLVSNKRDVQETTQLLAQTIDQTGINNGGKHDNLTVALLQLNANSKLKVKMDKKSKIVIGILSFLLIASITLNIYQLKYQNSQPKEQSAIEKQKDNSKDSTGDNSQINTQEKTSSTTTESPIKK